MSFFKISSARVRRFQCRSYSTIVGINEVLSETATQKSKTLLDGVGSCWGSRSIRMG